jgi:hypothetical protein
MKCPQCHAEHPASSKFCSDCGIPLKNSLECVQCGFENTRDSSFCTKCGNLISKGKKTGKGNQRKCGNCGQLNELDTLLCVSCGEKMIRGSGKSPGVQSANPSYKTIALAIGIILLVGFSFKLGQSLFKKEKSPALPRVSTSSSLPPSAAQVEEAMVITVAKNFKCACGGCGELPLATCECDMPRGAVEQKNFIREKLAAGFTVEQVVELVDKQYGHRI